MIKPSTQPGGRLLDGTIAVFAAEALVLPTGLLIVAILTRRLGPAALAPFGSSRLPSPRRSESLGSQLISGFSPWTFPSSASPTPTGTSWSVSAASPRLPPLHTVWRSAIVCALTYGLAATWMTPGWLLVAKLTAITLLVVVVYLSLGEIGKGELTSAYAVLNRRFAASHGRVS